MTVYELIKGAILEGTYGPGERLTEEYLASELELSRTPVREAIKRLEVEGLVIPLKRGIIVKAFTKEDIRQIYDLRALLEGYAASQAAIHRSDEDLRVLREANQPFAQLLQSFKSSDRDTINRIMLTNNGFHDAVFHASANDHIRLLISKVTVVPLMFRSYYWYDRERLARSVQTHDTIIEAISVRDSERAKSAIQEHIYEGRDLVLQCTGTKSNIIDF